MIPSFDESFDKFANDLKAEAKKLYGANMESLLTSFNKHITNVLNQMEGNTMEREFLNGI